MAEKGAGECGPIHSGDARKPRQGRRGFEGFMINDYFNRDLYPPFAWKRTMIHDHDCRPQTASVS